MLKAMGLLAMTFCALTSYFPFCTFPFLQYGSPLGIKFIASKLHIGPYQTCCYLSRSEFHLSCF